jgi:hypothetical protein
VKLKIKDKNNMGNPHPTLYSTNRRENKADV